MHSDCFVRVFGRAHLSMGNFSRKKSLYKLQNRYLLRTWQIENKYSKTVWKNFIKKLGKMSKYFCWILTKKDKEKSFSPIHIIRYVVHDCFYVVKVLIKNSLSTIYTHPLLSIIKIIKRNGNVFNHCIRKYLFIVI